MDDVTAKVDDQEIALLMMDGDEEGLRMLLKAYGAKALFVLRSRLGSTLTEQDLEDALSIAAWKAFRAAEHFDDDKGSLFGWFYSIAHNCAQDILRVENRHRHDDLLSCVDYTASDCPSIATNRPVDRSLRKAVEELPPLQKKVILADLTVQGEASDTELASRCGTTANSIRVSRHKALVKLKDTLIKMGFFAD